MVPKFIHNFQPVRIALSFRRSDEIEHEMDVQIPTPPIPPGFDGGLWICGNLCQNFGQYFAGFYEERVTYETACRK